MNFSKNYRNWIRWNMSLKRINYCKELTFLPKIPDKFINSILQFPMDHVSKGSRIDITKNNKIVRNCDYKRTRIEKYNASLLEWIKSNICINEFSNLADPDKLRRWIIMKSENGEYHTPHTDKCSGPHMFALKYFIELGGPNVSTTWYQEKGYPKVREGYVKPKTYDNLTPIYSIVAKTNTWYLFNSHVIHGVENIKSVRTAVSAWTN